MYFVATQSKAAVLLIPLERAERKTGSHHPQPQHYISIIVELAQNYVLSPCIYTSLSTFIITGSIFYFTINIIRALDLI